MGSFLPAPHQLIWFLRVGIPEVGWLLGLSCLPALVWLGRSSPYTAAMLAIVLLAPISLPWWQALAVARTAPAGLQRAFGKDELKRGPLKLGPAESVLVSTEPYTESLSWDRYRPTESQPKARILFVHGGSWRNGTRADYPQLFRYLAGRGYEVVSLTYSLAPEHPYPAALEDVDTAVDQLAGDGLPLFLGGRSSGGHLALLAAYLNPDKVAGVFAFYPPVDMVWSYHNPSNPAVLNSKEAIEQFLGVPPQDDPDRYLEASPIHQVGQDSPPTLLIHGQRDCLVYLKQSHMLSGALAKTGVPHYLLELPWAEHGSDITIYGPTGRLSCWAIEGFVEGVSGPK